MGSGDGWWRRQSNGREHNTRRPVFMPALPRTSGIMRRTTTTYAPISPTLRFGARNLGVSAGDTVCFHIA